MRKTTKILFGSAAVLATAALVQVATPATAGAEETTNPLAGKITVDAATQTVTINKDVLGDGKNRQIYFGIPKVSVKDNKGTVTAPTKWDVYDTVGSSSSDLVISLASLKNTVDNYIQIKGSADADPVTILIPKAEKYKAAFDPTATNALTVTNAKKDSSGKYPAYTGATEYRTQYGSWKAASLSGNPFAAYQEQGATLYLRVPASSTTDLASVTGVTYAMKKKKATDTPVTVDVKKAASFASAEFKVSIKKRADAKAVKVDFVKNTLSLQKGYAYRVSPIDELGDGEYKGGKSDNNVDFEKPATVDITESLLASEAEAMIEQKQVAKTTGDKKTIESKVAQLKVERAKTPVLTGTIASNDAKVDTDVTLKISDDKKKLTFENATNTIYQVYLKKQSTDPTVTDSKAKWTDLKAQSVKGSKVKNGNLTIKLPTSDADLYIRVKGNAKEYTFSSLALSLGKVKYDKDAADATAAANTKIANAVKELKKTTCPVTIKTDKSGLVLPDAPADVIYTWVSDNATTIDNDGKIVSSAAAGTVNMTVTVSATNGTSKKVKFAVTVVAKEAGDGFEISEVAAGVDA